MSPRPAPLPEALLEAVRQRARIEDLFPASELRKAGREYLARCPWHDDRRPSLTVSPQRNRVHCFVCSRGTDPIGWLQDRQGLSFSEAVQELAGRYGIPLPQEDPQAAARAEAERRERQRLLAWRAEQVERFHQALLADLDAQGPASGYLHERGLTRQTALDWQLGLNASRLMLPIRDGSGRCCGFSGRSIAGQEPKYRNSAADLLFRKSELVFGLDRAAPDIRRTGEVVLVEGPLDVLQLHQGGIENAVAALGTALTPEQRQRLQRHGARRLVLCLDGDPAGQQATARSIEQLRPLAIGGELELAVVSLPEGGDPDTLIRSEGAAAFRQRLQRARHWLSWELERLLAPALAQPDDLAVLQRTERQAAQLLALLPLGPLRHRAEQQLQQALGAVPAVVTPGSPAAPGQRMGNAPPQPPGCGETPLGHRETPLATAIERAERRALRLFLCSPSSRQALGGLALRTPQHQRAMGCLRQIEARLPPGPDGGTGGETDLLIGAVLSLCPRLDPELALLLEQLCRCGQEVQRILAADPGPELIAILDVLEPVAAES